MYEGYLFDRSANITIGKPGKTGRVFTDIRIKFKITKTSESSSNQAHIELYNLNSDSRGFLGGEGLVCVLKAGYKGVNTASASLDTIFSGDISHIKHERKGADMISSLECGDSQKKLTKTHTEQTFKKGTKTKHVIKALVDKLGIPVGKMEDLSESSFPHGITLSGNVKDLMDKMLAREGKEWHVQDSELYIIDPNKKDINKAIVVSKDTGLIGIPVAQEKGLEITTLLIPSIKPGRVIQLISSGKTGFFFVREAVYEGDSVEGEWQVKAIVK